MTRVLLILLTLSSLAPRAPAASPDVTEARVEALVERAREQRRVGDYDAAIASLKSALSLKTEPFLLYGLARVYEDASRYDLARSYYDLCLGDNTDAETRTRAAEGISRLDKVGERGRLVLSVTPEDAAILIDGEPWKLDANHETMLTAGSHRLEVSRAGFVADAQTIQIIGGQANTIGVRLAQVPKEVVRTVERIVTPQPLTSFDPSPWQWLTLGIGAVATGVGVYAFVDGNANWDAAAAKASKDPTFDDLLSSGREKRTAGIVAMAAGGTMLIASIGLIIADDSGTVPVSAAWVAPLLSSNQAGLALGNSF